MATLVTSHTLNRYGHCSNLTPKWQHNGSLKENIGSERSQKWSQALGPKMTPKMGSLDTKFGICLIPFLESKLSAFRGSLN